MGQKVQNIKIALWRRKEGSEGNAAKDITGRKEEYRIYDNRIQIGQQIGIDI